MSKRLLTAYTMTATLLLAGFLGHVAAQSSAPRCLTEVSVSVQERPTGSLIFGVGVNSDAGLTGSVALNERKSDLNQRCAQNEQVSVDVRVVSLSASFYERINQEVLREQVAGSEPRPGRDRAAGAVRLAFLGDSQVSRLLHVAQADPRTKVMQTPKTTLASGQESTVGITEQHFFVTGVYVTTKDEQPVFVPQNEPLSTGLQLCMQPTLSADRHSIHMKLKARQTELRSAKVRQFPVTTSIRPVFEGGAVGAPVPFTQFIQQPDSITVSMEKEVVVPDGGTVLLSGWAKVPQLPDNDEPSALSSIPLIGWLFAKPADSPEEERILVLLTPRIVIEE